MCSAQELLYMRYNSSSGQSSDTAEDAQTSPISETGECANTPPGKGSKKVSSRAQSAPLSRPGSDNPRTVRKDHVSSNFILYFEQKQDELKERARKMLDTAKKEAFNFSDQQISKVNLCA